MPGQNHPQPAPTPPPGSPFTTSAERTRPPSADELEVEIDDPRFDLACDDAHRLEEDAHPTSD